jgi:hypothetical protein
MRTRSDSPWRSSQHEASAVTGSIALSTWKRLPWWLQTVMKLWRIVRPQHSRRGTDPPEEGNGNIGTCHPVTYANVIENLQSLHEMIGVM